VQGELLDDGVQKIHTQREGSHVEPTIEKYANTNKKRQETMVAFFDFDAYTWCPLTGCLTSTHERKQFE